MKSTDLREIGEGIFNICHAVFMDRETQREAELHIKSALQKVWNEAIEGSAKFMEEYGCSACDHFHHDNSPDLLRDLKLPEEDGK